MQTDLIPEGISCASARLMDDAVVAAIKRRYDRDGFVVLRGFASPEDVGQLLCHAQGAVQVLRADPARKGKPYPDVFKNLETQSPWLASQLTDGVHVPLMRLLLGDELVPSTAAWFDRPSGSDAAVNPHIDGGGRGGNVVGATIWIALDAADRGNGCLHYRPGSHRMQHPDGVFLDGFDTESNAVAVEVKPGDAVIHSALTAHWSGTNPSERPRRAVSFFYLGARSQADFPERMARKKGA